MARGKYRKPPVTAEAKAVARRPTEAFRAEAAWYMYVGDILIGQRLGFSYPMSGDHRPLSMEKYLQLPKN